MNLKQLSHMLSLSQTTVSRALNGYPEVNEETRRRVLRKRSARACVATAMPQPMSTHGNQSVPGVSHRLIAAERSVPVTKATSKLLEDALKLDVGERAELASELIASLDAEADEGAEAAWAVEIEERAARARSGEDPGKPWPEVRDRLERDLKNR